MKKIVEKTLDAALIKASMELQCSVVDLEYEVIQHSSNGFLGIGKKMLLSLLIQKLNLQSLLKAMQNKSQPLQKELPIKILSKIKNRKQI